MSASSSPKVAARGREDGSVLLLGLGLVAVTLLLVGAVVDASRLFLTRESLATVADAAALRGAQSIDVARVYRSGVHESLPLAATSARAEVVRVVATRAAAAGLRDVRVVAVRVVGGTVEVTISTVVHLPLAGTALGRPDGVVVTATAAARTDVAP